MNDPIRIAFREWVDMMRDVVPARSRRDSLGYLLRRQGSGRMSAASPRATCAPALASPNRAGPPRFVPTAPKAGTAPRRLPDER